VPDLIIADYSGKSRKGKLIVAGLKKTTYSHFFSSFFRKRLALRRPFCLKNLFAFVCASSGCAGLEME
jgi:hypothetical protein